MIDKYRVKVVNEAIRRLREAAYARAVKDERGQITREGYPTPGQIADELNWIYKKARARATKETTNAR